MKPFYRVLTYLALVIQSLIILCLLAERKVPAGDRAVTFCHRERAVPQAMISLPRRPALPAVTTGFPLFSCTGYMAHNRATAICLLSWNNGLLPINHIDPLLLDTKPDLCSARSRMRYTY